MHEYGAKVVMGNLNDQQFADALKYFPANDPAVHRGARRDGPRWLAAHRRCHREGSRSGHPVNNAGVGLQQSASTGSLKDWEWAGVNLWGPIYVCEYVFPWMLAKKTGAHLPPPPRAASCRAAARASTRWRRSRPWA
jgi:hypothetical protein